MLVGGVCLSFSSRVLCFVLWCRIFVLLVSMVMFWLMVEVLL